MNLTWFQLVGMDLRVIASLLRYHRGGLEYAALQ
jgi:hypothetical protein